jgi:hypothetical protein
VGEGVPGLGNAATTLDNHLALAQVELPIPGIVANSTTFTNTGEIWTIWTSLLTNTISVTSTTTNTNMIWTAWHQQLQQAIETNITSTASTLIGQPLNQTTGNLLTASIWGAWTTTLTTLQNATREQVEAAQRLAQAQQAEQVRTQASRNEALDRAEKLLHKVLNPKQREELKEKNFFTLETFSKSGERRLYRIRRGRSGNVEQVDEAGNRIKRLCAHPIEAVPDADTMVGQKLWLEGAEEEFLRIANHS